MLTDFQNSFTVTIKRQFPINNAAIDSTTSKVCRYTIL